MASSVLKSLGRKALVSLKSSKISFLRPTAKALEAAPKPSFPSFSFSGLASHPAPEADDAPYVSELQDLFDQMEANGPTTLGTTEPILHNETYLACGVPESALRFTSTSYGRIDLAPFVHPNEHRVILTVQTRDLPLNGIEMEILREIVGKRLTDKTLRLSSNHFGSRIENKRYLVSMLDRMVASCQNLAREVEKEAAAA